MIISLSYEELKDYLSRQLNHFFPDRHTVSVSQLSGFTDTALDRMDYCFRHVSFGRYNENGNTKFNHLYADQYLLFLWYLANTAWKNGGNENLCSKLYYLNKSLHAFDCMYNTALPDIFLVFHGAGTMLGKATYADFFLVLQGCTVGSQRGDYPVLGKGVTLTANSSVIGKCMIGDRCTIGGRTMVFQKNMDNDSSAYIDVATGALKFKSTGSCYAQQYFNIDLKTL